MRLPARKGHSMDRLGTTRWIAACGMILLAASLTRGDLLQVSVPADPEAMMQGYEPVRSRLVTVDLAQLDALAQSGGGSIAINFFPDALVNVEFRKVVRRSASSYTLLGHVSGDDLSSAVVAVEGDVAIATVRVPGLGTYIVDSLPGGGQVACELNAGAGRRCACAASDGPLLGVAGYSELPPADPLRDGSDSVIIDVLVIYTPAARDQAGGEDAMRALVFRAADEMNFSLERTHIAPRIRLVGVQQIDYAEDPSDLLTDLECMSLGWCGGSLQEPGCASVREPVGADLVSLIVQSNPYPPRGAAYLLRSLDDFWNADSVAFSVLKRPSLLDDTFCHELGHNLGCHHEREDTSFPGLFDYSHAYRPQYGYQWSTIMHTGVNSILAYSNPDALYDGEPTGVPIDRPNSAHNALTIAQSAAYVATYREATVHPCLADITGDAVVDQHDLGVLLASYEHPADSPLFDAGADLDGDNDVDRVDLGILLDRYGTVCD
ncbi:MAG: M12 family metallo-peptidase [Phycisphaerales bacterium JB038]